MSPSKELRIDAYHNGYGRGICLFILVSAKMVAKWLRRLSKQMPPFLKSDFCA
jgi:hypothetical protein